jgi:hypothetical protein
MIGMFLSFIFGLIGPILVWQGKKQMNPKMMLWGAGMTLASYFLFSF